VCADRLARCVVERQSYAEAAVAERRARTELEASAPRMTGGEGAGLALMLTGVGLTTWALLRRRGPALPMVGAGAAGVIVGAGMVVRF